MKPRKWLRPAALEAEYRKYVREAARLTEAVIEQYIIPTVDLRQDAIEDLPESAGWFETLRQAFLSSAAKMAGSPITARVTEFSRRLNTFNKQQFTKVVRAAYGVDVFAAESWVEESLKVWEAENIKLIRSIPQQSLESLHGKIVNAIKQGTPTRELKTLIRESYGTTRSRASLIARDQVGKLNGELTEKRQESIGVESYKWRGSLDERERDTHVSREGLVFKWSEPPPGGHPGMDYQCRCTAEAILPLLAAIQGQLQYPDLSPTRGTSLTKLARKQRKTA